MRLRFAGLWLASMLSCAVAQDGRLSLVPDRYVLDADASSPTVYYVSPANTAIASLPLAGATGLNDVYRDGGTLCLAAWVDGAPPIAPGCAGAYVGTINPVDGVARCDLTRGYARRCDVWNHYNRVPITLEVGAPEFLPPCQTQCFNGWRQVTTDGIGRFFWDDSRYHAVLMLGRKGERVRIEIRAIASLYSHANYSSTGLIYHFMAVGWNAVSMAQAGVCGYLANHASHIDTSQIGRFVELQMNTTAACDAPFFEGAAQANAVESAGSGNALVISSAARWSFQMTARYHY